MIVIEERKIRRMLEGLFQFGKECEWNDAIEEAMHRFVNLPTIEAEPVKHGRWIYDDEAYPGGNPYGHYVCDQCGEYVPHKTNYCPNCGAKMDEEE